MRLVMATVILLLMVRESSAVSCEVARQYAKMFTPEQLEAMMVASGTKLTTAQRQEYASCFSKKQSKKRTKKR